MCATLFLSQISKEGNFLQGDLNKNVERVLETVNSRDLGTLDFGAHCGLKTELQSKRRQANRKRNIGLEGQLKLKHKR